MKEKILLVKVWVAGEICQWILTVSDYKLVNVLLENSAKEKEGENYLA